MARIAALMSCVALTACGGGSDAATVAPSPAPSPAPTPTPAPAPSGSPVVLFADVPCGPVSGGENNLGAYLSIFGRNLGSASGLGTATTVTIGGVAVANYRYLGPSKVSARLGMQELVVQVGDRGRSMTTSTLVKDDLFGTARGSAVDLGAVNRPYRFARPITTS